MKLHDSIRLTSLSLIAALSLATVAEGQVNVLTYHNDNFRTGLNSQETALSPTTVSENTFGLLYRLPVDGAIVGEPLSVAGVPVKGMGNVDLIFVVTENNSVYAFNAGQSAATSPVWHVNLGPSVPNGDTGSGDIQPIVGISGTPVIRLTNSPGKGYIYLVAKTKETSDGNTVYVQRLHALNITNGDEMTNSPVVISATVAGTGDGSDGNGNLPFNSLIQHNRSALLYVNNGKTNNIYIAWASHGDNGPFHGWVMAYDAISLKQVAVFNDTPNATASENDNTPAGGGIWQSGGGLSCDGNSIFAATGNGVFDPSTGAWGDAVLRLSPGLSVLDYFAPSDEYTLDTTDGDLGASGAMVIPQDPVYNPSKQIMVQTTKRGNLYLIDERNLGHYNPNQDDVYEEINGAMGDLWGNPAYYNGTIFYGPASQPVCSFKVSDSQITPASIQSTGGNSYGYPGPTPAVSSNGNSGGIVWAVDSSAYEGSSNPGPAQLWAYDASNLGSTLYSSANSNGRDVMGTAVKFVTPLVEGGHVYVGTQSELDVFGLGNFTTSPSIETASGTYRDAVAVKISDIDPKAKIYYTLNGSEPTQASKTYTGPIEISKNATLRVRAFSAGASPSGVLAANYQIGALPGTGKGLAGKYFASADPHGSPVASELAPTVDYDWNGAKPCDGIADKNWSGVWEGSIQPTCSTDYTFSTNSDGGVRVWINGEKVIDRWDPHSLALDSSRPVSMVAGRKYSIRIERAQGKGLGRLQFLWSSPGMDRQIVPASQLYSQ